MPWSALSLLWLQIPCSHPNPNSATQEGRPELLCMQSLQHSNCSPGLLYSMFDSNQIQRSKGNQGRSLNQQVLNVVNHQNEVFMGHCKTKLTPDTKH